MAAGADNSDSNGTNSGNVRVFVYDSGTNRWNQLGHEMMGESEGDLFGQAVALSANGKVVAVGCRHSDGNGVSSGLVRVFAYDPPTDRWIMPRQDLDGMREEDNFGSSVALSADGNVVAAGAKFHDGNGAYSGQVRVFSGKN